jgi:hypothetical protein
MPWPRKKFVAVCENCHGKLTNTYDCAYNVEYQLAWDIACIGHNYEDARCPHCGGDQGDFVIVNTKRAAQLLAMINDPSVDWVALERYMNMYRVKQTCTCGRHKGDPSERAYDAFWNDD